MFEKEFLTLAIWWWNSTNEYEFGVDFSYKVRKKHDSTRKTLNSEISPEILRSRLLLKSCYYAKLNYFWFLANRKNSWEFRNLSRDKTCFGWCNKFPDFFFFSEINSSSDRKIRRKKLIKKLDALFVVRFNEVFFFIWERFVLYVAEASM